MRWKHLLRPGLAAALLAAGWLGAGTVAFAEDEEARELYINTCSKCHGGILEEEKTAGFNPDFVIRTVTMPLGPTLNGIYGRVAGTVEGYAYSKSFRAAAQNPWVWDEDTLDTWLTNTQEFIRGSTMIFKVPDTEVRTKIIGYLKKYSQCADKPTGACGSG